MNLSLLLQYKKIEALGYDTAYTEQPFADIIDIDWKSILDKPPSNTSTKTIQELELISKLTKSRSQKDIDLVLKIDKELDQPFIILLKQYNKRYPQKYINMFYDIIKPLIHNTKNYWNRPRPKQLADMYNIDINVILTDTHHTASYPSGHTVYSNLVALIIKDLFNEIDQKELTNIVSETAKARVLQGVHFPTDNKASLVFSNTLFNYLQPKLRKYYESTT
jgi:hypothetical protein